MAFSVQNDVGDVVGANAYVALADFKAYHDDRGNSYSGFTDQQLQSAIVRATDYLDSRFRFKGIKLSSTQTTMWPRKAGSDTFVAWWDVNFLTPEITFDNINNPIPLNDPNGNPIIGIPAAVKNATCEYALRALAQPLYQDAPADESGRLVLSESITVDTISQTKQYAASQGTGTFQMPAYPIADMMLARAGIIGVSRSVYR